MDPQARGATGQDDDAAGGEEDTGRAARMSGRCDSAGPSSQAPPRRRARCESRGSAERGGAAKAAGVAGAAANDEPRPGAGAGQGGEVGAGSCFGVDAGRVNYKFTDLRREWTYLADNDFIRRGYRASLSWRECVTSMFQVHNETVNVWSHLVGAVVFVALMVKLSAMGMLPDMPSLPLHDVLVPAAPAAAASELCALHPAGGFALPGGCETGHFLSGGMHTALAFADVAGTASAAAAAGEAQSRPLLPWFGEHVARVGEWSAERTHEAAASAGAYAAQMAEHLDGLRREYLGAFSLASGAGAARDAALARVHAMRSMLDTHAAAHAMRAALSAGGETAESAAAAAAEAAKHALGELAALKERLAAHGPHVTPAALPDWPIMVFLLSAFVCLASSATFHLFHCHSQVWFDRLAKMDYAGIGILIAGSSVPVLYYGFFCRPALRWLYIGLMGVACAVCVGIVFVDRFKRPEYRTFRMLAFVTTALVGVGPIGHMLLSAGLESLEIRTIIGPLLVMGALYLGGAALYAARLPERLLPGTFDFVMSSHQIFHACVFAATLVHYYCVVSHYDHRSQHWQCEAGMSLPVPLQAVGSV